MNVIIKKVKFGFIVSYNGDDYAFSTLSEALNFSSSKLQD